LDLRRLRARDFCNAFLTQDTHHCIPMVERGFEARLCKRPS